MRDAIQAKLDRDAQERSYRELYAAQDRDGEVRYDPMRTLLPDPQAPQSGIQRSHQNGHPPMKTRASEQRNERRQI